MVEARGSLERLPLSGLVPAFGAVLGWADVARSRVVANRAMVGLEELACPADRDGTYGASVGMVGVELQVTL
jgi:hypothetical protein